MVDSTIGQSRQSCLAPWQEPIMQTHLQKRPVQGGWEGSWTCDCVSSGKKVDNLLILKQEIVLFRFVNQCSKLLDQRPSIFCMCHQVMELPLRTYARKFSNIDFFSENFTIERSWVSDVRNVKKMGGHRLRFVESMPGRTPKIVKSKIFFLLSLIPQLLLLQFHFELFDKYSLVYNKINKDTILI